MNTRRRTLAAMVALLLVAAAEPADEIKGIWAVESATLSGVKVPDDPTEGAQMTAFDGKAYVQRAGSRIVEEGTYTVDPSKSPRTIDFEIAKGPDAGKTQLGIYELTGDTLKVCVAQPGARRRPKSFDAGSGSGVLVVVNKRFRP